LRFEGKPEAHESRKEKSTMANSNGNQFRDDEIVVLTVSRDGKMVKSIHPKIGGRLRSAHEQNQQISSAETSSYAMEREPPSRS
jgi:hypothetical protein